MNYKKVSGILFGVFALFSLLFYTLSIPVNAAETYVFATKWGSPGSGDGMFNQVVDVAVDRSGNVYVSDYYNARVQKFNSSGGFITKWGSVGTGDGQFRAIGDIAIDASENVYVLDWGNDRVQKFDSNGRFLTKWGSEGTGDGQFIAPSGLAVDASGNVYVSDAGNDYHPIARIQKFASDGRFLAKWGTIGTGDGQFTDLFAIAADSYGYIYAAEGTRIQKFKANGTFITKWGSAGSGDGQFYGPNKDIAVDRAGNVYLADCGSYRIQKFKADGTFLTKWGSYGTGNYQFGEPVGVAVDSQGKVYVADGVNNRIQKFAPGPVLIKISPTTPIRRVPIPKL